MKAYLAALCAAPLLFSPPARAQEGEITYINRAGEKEKILFHYFTEGDRGVLRLCAPDGSSGYDIVGRPVRSDEKVRLEARSEGITVDMPDQLCTIYSDEPGKNMLECIDK